MARITEQQPGSVQKSEPGRTCFRLDRNQWGFDKPCFQDPDVTRAGRCCRSLLKGMFASHSSPPKSTTQGSNTQSGPIFVIVTVAFFFLSQHLRDDSGQQGRVLGARGRWFISCGSQRVCPRWGGIRTEGRERARLFGQGLLLWTLLALPAEGVLPSSFLLPFPPFLLSFWEPSGQEKARVFPGCPPPQTQASDWPLVSQPSRRAVPSGPHGLESARSPGSHTWPPPPGES